MNQERIFNVLVTHHVSEKSALAMENNNQYVFKVAVDAKKPEIKKAVESAFGVTVSKVQTSVAKGKVKRFGQNAELDPELWFDLSKYRIKKMEEIDKSLMDSVANRLRELIDETNYQLKQTLFMIAAFCSFILLLSSLIIASIAKPIQQLVDVIQRASQENDTRLNITVSGNDEIAIIF